MSVEDGKHARKHSNAQVLKLVTLTIVPIVAVAIIITTASRQGDEGVRSPGGSYTDSTEKNAGSIELMVKYKANCEGRQDCDIDKQDVDLKVLVFDKKGNQVRVIRSDDKGVFKASMPEGEYILLVAKAIEGEGLPQERISLKNGKTLKLNLNYGTEVR